LATSETITLARLSVCLWGNFESSASLYRHLPIKLHYELALAAGVLSIPSTSINGTNLQLYPAAELQNAWMVHLYNNVAGWLRRSSRPLSGGTSIRIGEVTGKGEKVDGKALEANTGWFSSQAMNVVFRNAFGR